DATREQRTSGELVGSSSNLTVPQTTQRELVDQEHDGFWRLQVQVVDATGDPVASALLEWQESVDSVAHVAGTTNSDGICQLETDVERLFVRAHAAGIGRSLLVPASNDDGGQCHLRLLLWRPVRMTGVVLGANAR